MLLLPPRWTIGAASVYCCSTPQKAHKSTIRAWWRRFGEKGRGECEEAEAGEADIYVTCVARWTMMVVAVAHCCDIPQDVHMK